VDRSHRNVQAKLLHVLDRREFRPVGGLKPKTADVRIICATNTDLAHAIQKGQFLEDLYYRLNDFQFSLPPLRERREDIPVLVRHFLARAHEESARRPAGITRETMRRLMDHEWRGNVRELEKCVRRFIVLCEDGEWIVRPAPKLQEEGSPATRDALRCAMRPTARNHLIRRTLEETGETSPGRATASAWLPGPEKIRYG
jgi:DNA-binding NtrC family response regulator